MATENYIYLLTGSCGRWVLQLIGRVADLFGFFVVCLKTILRNWRTGKRLMARTIVQQVYFTGLQSLELTSIIALLLPRDTIVA